MLRTDPWYVPDRRIMTPSARRAAIRITGWIKTQNGSDPEPEERELFVAMHTCAYRSVGRPGDAWTTQGELTEWADRWQLIRGYIIERNTGLAYAMSRRFGSGFADPDDVLSDAMMGLAHAVDRFNPWRGYRFSTYACNAIVRDLGRLGRRESRHRRLRSRLTEVADYPDSPPDFRTELYVERLRRALDRNLGGLTELESEVIARRFPDHHPTGLTFKEIGDTIGLSKERVRQIQNVALGKLRAVLLEDPVLQG